MNRKRILAGTIVIAILAVSIASYIYFSAPSTQGISVEFVQSFSDVKIYGNTATKYQYHIVIPRETTWTTPFGGTSVQLEKALQPLVSKYNLVTIEEDGILTAAHESLFIQSGESTFSLYSHDALNTQQINSLTADLRNAIAEAPNY
jgi:hypothetical protein